MVCIHIDYIRLVQLSPSRDSMLSARLRLLRLSTTAFRTPSLVLFLCLLCFALPLLCIALPLNALPCLALPCALLWIGHPLGPLGGHVVRECLVAPRFVFLIYLAPQLRVRGFRKAILIFIIVDLALLFHCVRHCAEDDDLAILGFLLGFRGAAGVWFHARASREHNLCRVPNLNSTSEPTQST